MYKFNDIYNYETFEKLQNNQELTETENVELLLMDKKLDANKESLLEMFETVIGSLEEQITAIQEDEALESELVQNLEMMCFLARCRMVQGSFVNTTIPYEVFEQKVFDTISLARAYILEYSEVLNNHENPMIGISLSKECVATSEHILAAYMEWMKYNECNFPNLLLFLNITLHQQQMFAECEEEYERLVEYYDSYQYDKCVPEMESLYHKLDFSKFVPYAEEIEELLAECKELLALPKRESYMNPCRKEVA